MLFKKRITESEYEKISEVIIKANEELKPFCFWCEVDKRNIYLCSNCPNGRDYMFAPMCAKEIPCLYDYIKDFVEKIYPHLAEIEDIKQH